MISYEDSMLFASLIQISHITRMQEAKYWKQGVFTLRDLASNNISKQLSIFTTCMEKEISDLIKDRGRDIDLIAKRFESKTGKRDFYRIAYSIPENVMFLDIETTGLSTSYHYVTLIGWMMNGKYGCWISGLNPMVFFKAYRQSKMLVTFNGTRFDCSFIDSTFPNLKIKEKPNLDLMYFCRRYGYTKGQKNIEKLLGYVRPDNVKECSGKDAIALWYQFLFGDDCAIEKLIEYNFQDILGMAYILDSIFYRHIYNTEFLPACKTERFYSDKCRNTAHYSAQDMGSVRKHIKSKNFNLNQLVLSSCKRVVGIDLAGLVNNNSHTGICLLAGNKASVKTVKFDEEIIQYIVEAKADLVSIDAPLSLPNGRKSVYDDDPMREEAGIMRYSERELHRRGVNSYPALIRSMQELTKRGIGLSIRLRKMGYPVIECFPGAAQDIFQLPRKRTDEQLLKAGLINLGIHGDFESRKVVHDELDAITAALVGRLFIDGYYEAIGIPEENDMIVPCMKKANDEFRVVIGITGHIAAGKTTVANYIRMKGFKCCRYSQVLADSLRSKNVAVNRSSLQEEGLDLFDSSGQYALNLCVEERLRGCPCVVIDGMRHFEDYTYWKEKCFSKFYLLYVEAGDSLCMARYREGDYQTVSKHRAEAETDKLLPLADVVIDNVGSYGELYTKIDSFLKKII